MDHCQRPHPRLSKTINYIYHQIYGFINYILLLCTYETTNNYISMNFQAYDQFYGGCWSYSLD